MYRKMQFVVMFLFVFSAAAWAQGQDPFIGTWKTNIAKSKYDPGPPPKVPTTVKIEATPDGAVKTTVDGVDAQGNPTHEEYTAKYDGKDYPVKGSPNWDTVVIRRMDPRTRVTVNKKGGIVTRMIRGVVSPDGKTRTNAAIAIDAAGKSTHNVTVFDKQ